MRIKFLMALVGCLLGLTAAALAAAPVTLVDGGKAAATITRFSVAVTLASSSQRSAGFKRVLRSCKPSSTQTSAPSAIRRSM